jgi:hypothetical protein
MPILEQISQLHDEREDSILVGQYGNDTFRFLFISKHLYETGKHEIGEIWFQGDRGADCIEQLINQLQDLLMQRKEGIMFNNEYHKDMEEEKQQQLEVKPIPRISPGRRVRKDPPEGKPPVRPAAYE